MANHDHIVIRRQANLLVDVGQAIQNLPEESPEAAVVQVQSLVDGVPQSALLTVLHLSSGHRHRTRGGNFNNLLHCF